MGYKMNGFSGFGNSPAKDVDMEKLRSKQERMSKGISEFQYFADPKSQGDEPPVSRSDFDEGSEQQKMFDRNQAKSKAKKSPNKKRGLWDNIHAKRKRGEKMRKPGSKGAPTDKALKESQSPNKLMGLVKKKVNKELDTPAGQMAAKAATGGMA